MALLILSPVTQAQTKTTPEQIKFTRQGVKRLVFDREQAVSLATLKPETIIGLAVMHPNQPEPGQTAAVVSTDQNMLIVQSHDETQTAIWLGGFNPFATYIIDLAFATGENFVGFEFTDANRAERMLVYATFKDTLITDVRLKVIRNKEIVADRSIAVNNKEPGLIGHGIILQMLGSGLVMYSQNKGLPKVIAQADYNKQADLRGKQYLNGFHTNLYLGTKNGEIKISRADIALTAGMRLADIRPVTYEDGEPMIDQGRLWYTMSIRGRGLPHALQGVFSMNPSVFDIKFEGIVVFDRNDGILRNEVASHLFFDRKNKMWRGVTTGFSAYANPEKEKKQLLIIESKRDPRFGFSIMNARPFQMVGDMEDPHMLYDARAKKWRMISCTNQNGYKAILSESDEWDRGTNKLPALLHITLPVHRCKELMGSCTPFLAVMKTSYLYIHTLN
ncbi:hypothetical protein [Mucilaginibacter antarcticus]|uniref:hypothetical protein n=1 Tax=Mucilaginibacter antarcticus TaxID=1855725 RepID=UPI00362D62BB